MQHFHSPLADFEMRAASLCLRLARRTRHIHSLHPTPLPPPALPTYHTTTTTITITTFRSCRPNKITRLFADSDFTSPTSQATSAMLSAICLASSPATLGAQKTTLITSSSLLQTMHDQIWRPLALPTSYRQSTSRSRYLMRTWNQAGQQGHPMERNDTQPFWEGREHRQGEGLSAQCTSQSTLVGLHCCA